MTVFMPTPADLLMRPGMDPGATRWIELHERRIDQFADATGELRWAHVDHDRAAGKPFRSSVAHHSVVLALVPALRADLIQVGRGHVLFDFRIGSAEFPDPVGAGGRVRPRA
jgi:acyl dehydratase